MRMFEGDRGSVFIEIPHDEIVPFYLVMAAGFTNEYQWKEIEERKPGTRHWWARCMELLKRRLG